MRDQFPGYYRPSEAEFKVLWDTAVIVLDTNVLLHVYQVPARTRSDLFAALNKFKGRLWVPHHVALEFQRRRLGVIANQQRSASGSLDGCAKSISDVTAQIVQLELDKWDAGINPDPLIDALKNAEEQIRAVMNASSGKTEASLDDPIRSNIEGLLERAVGAAPPDQAWVDALAKEGDRRYGNRVPPGFLDADKDKDPKTASFVHGGIHYQRKFGDLIAWKQLLQHANSAGLSAIIFVTSDTKEDWWLYEGSDRVGPLPELVNEIKRETQVGSFWMYSLRSFLNQSNTYTKGVKIPDEALLEVAVAERRSLTARRPKLPPEIARRVSARSAIQAWAESLGRKTATPSTGFGIDLVDVTDPNILFVKIVEVRGAEDVVSERVSLEIANIVEKAGQVAIVFLMPQAAVLGAILDGTWGSGLSSYEYAAESNGASLYAVGAIDRHGNFSAMPGSFVASSRNGAGQ